MSNNNKQEEERYHIIHDFIMNKDNDSGISTDQHYKDAREFLVYITKFYDTFSKLRTEASCYIRMNQIFNKEERLKTMKKINKLLVFGIYFKYALVCGALPIKNLLQIVSINEYINLKSLARHKTTCRKKTYF